MGLSCVTVPDFCGFYKIRELSFHLQIVVPSIMFLQTYDKLFLRVTC